MSGLIIAYKDLQLMLLQLIQQYDASVVTSLSNDIEIL